MGIRYDRLLTLAEWLERPQEELGHDRFSFSRFHVEATDENPVFCAGGEVLTCGTLGCACGELPSAFPGAFRVLELDEPPLLWASDSDPGFSLTRDVREFFGIDITQYEHLFIPGEQVEDFGGMELYGDATKEQVAGNIRAFVKTMRAKEVQGV